MFDVGILRTDWGFVKGNLAIPKGSYGVLLLHGSTVDVYFCLRPEFELPTFRKIWWNIELYYKCYTSDPTKLFSRSYFLLFVILFINFTVKSDERRLKLQINNG